MFYVVNVFVYYHKHCVKEQNLFYRIILVQAVCMQGSLSIL